MGKVIIAVLALALAGCGTYRHDDGAGDLYKVVRFMNR